MPLRNPSEKGTRREWARRYGLNGYPEIGGVNKEGAASAIGPHELRHGENLRFYDNARNRGGQSKYSATPFTGTVVGIGGFGPADGAPNPRNGSDAGAPDQEDGSRPQSYGGLYPRLYILHQTQNYVVDPDASPQFQKYPTAAPAAGIGDATGAAYRGQVILGGTDRGDAVSTDIVLRVIDSVPLPPPGGTFLGSAPVPRVHLRTPDLTTTGTVFTYINARGVLYFATIGSGSGQGIRVYSWDGTTLKLDALVDSRTAPPLLFGYQDGVAITAERGLDLVYNLCRVRSPTGVWTTLAFDPSVVNSSILGAVSLDTIYLGGFDVNGNGCIHKFDGNKFLNDRLIGVGDNILTMVAAPTAGGFYYLHGKNTAGNTPLRVGAKDATGYNDTIKDLSAQFPGDGVLVPECMAIFRDRMYVLASAGATGYLYSASMSALTGAWTKDGTLTGYSGPLGYGPVPLNRLVGM